MTVTELIQRLELFDPRAHVDICIVTDGGGRLAEVLAAIPDARGRVRIFGEQRAS